MLKQSLKVFYSFLSQKRNSGKPKSFYATFHASAIPASFSDDLEEALDEF